MSSDSKKIGLSLIAARKIDKIVKIYLKFNNDISFA